MTERLIVHGWPVTYLGRTYQVGEEIARSAIPPAQLGTLLSNGGIRAEDSGVDPAVEESHEEVLAGTIPALKAEIASWESGATLSALLAAEEAGRNRAGAIEAIEARIAELEA